MNAAGVGCDVVDGYRCVSNRGYNNKIINFDDCRVPASKILGQEHRGFDAANDWLGVRNSSRTYISQGNTYFNKCPAVGC